LREKNPDYDDTYIVRKCWKIGPHQHQSSYFPEKVPSQWKCNMAAQVRTECDWLKETIHRGNDDVVAIEWKLIPD
jgi:hypothetical protein